VLVARAELPNLIDNRGQQGFGGELAMPFEAFNQAWFAALFAFIVSRFGYAVGVERKGIAGNDEACYSVTNRSVKWRLAAVSPTLTANHTAQKTSYPGPHINLQE